MEVQVLFWAPIRFLRKIEVKVGYLLAPEWQHHRKSLLGRYKVTHFNHKSVVLLDISISPIKQHLVLVQLVLKERPPQRLL